MDCDKVTFQDLHTFPEPGKLIRRGTWKATGRTIRQFQRPNGGEVLESGEGASFRFFPVSCTRLTGLGSQDSPWVALFPQGFAVEHRLRPSKSGIEALSGEDERPRHPSEKLTNRELVRGIMVTFLHPRLAISLRIDASRHLNLRSNRCRDRRPS